MCTFNTGNNKIASVIFAMKLTVNDNITSILVINKITKIIIQNVERLGSMYYMIKTGL